MEKQRNKIVPASYLILSKDGKILLQKRFNTGYMDGFYSLPAGHVDRGENFTQCIIREAKEEIGVCLKTENLKIAHVMHRDSRLENPKGVSQGINERVDVFFIAEKWDGDIENKEPEKCDDISWFGLERLPENVVPYVRQVLININKNIFYSEFGW